MSLEYSKSLPYIDYQKLLLRNPEELQVLAECLQHHGMYYLKVPNEDRQMLQEVYSVSRHFFTNDLERKSSVIMTDEYPYGYENQSETLSKSMPNEHDDEGDDHDDEDVDNDVPDLKETFQVCLNHPNTLWPDCVPEMKAIFTSYYRRMEEICSEIMKVYAAILKEESETFTVAFHKHCSSLRTLYYPMVNHKVEADHVMASAHTDYGLITILAQDMIGGLQVEVAGNWCDVTPERDTFIINTGDLLQRWTGNVWVSPSHRVVCKDPKSARQSIAYFCNPSEDTVVSTLKQFQNNGVEYSSITAGEHIHEKYRASLNN